MEAVIMAGGEGTRLRPLTLNRPKPMIPLCDRPLLEYTVDLLRKYAFHDICMTLHYLPRAIMDHFEDGSAFGVRIHYSVEDAPLGTAGGVKKAVGEADGPVLVFSGDILTDVDLGAMLEFHKKSGSWTTIALTKVKYPTEYGIALLDEEWRITKYLEKPSWPEVFSDLANMGIYILEPEALKMIPDGKEFDFSNDLFPKMLKEGAPLFGWVAKGYYWSDIGNPSEYLKANLDILRGNVSVTLSAIQVSDGVWMAEGADVHPEAEIYPHVYIGKNVRVKRKAVVGESAIFSNSVVEEGARVENSIIWSSSFIGFGSNISGAIVAERCIIDSNASVGEGAIIADECRLGSCSMIKPNVYIWPSKYVEPYSVIDSHLKWGFGAKRGLFGEWGIEGSINADMTPELALKVGMAVGTWTKPGSSIAIARDPFRSSRIIKRALIAGLMASGIRVLNLKTAPNPVLRYYQLKHGLPASIMVSTPITRADVVRIKLLDKDGLPLALKDEKKIERIIFYNEFSRVKLEELGSNIYVGGYVDEYIDYLLSKFEIKAKSKPLIVVDCAYGSSSQVAPILFEMAGLRALVLNSYVGDDIPARVAEDTQAYASRLAAIVRSAGAIFGVMFDEDGDRIFLVDDKGRGLRGDEALAAMVKMALEDRGGGNVVVTSTASRMIEVVAEEYNAKVIRVQYGIKGVARAALERRAVVAGDEGGSFIIPKVSYMPDGFAAALFIAERLLRNNIKLSELVDGLPKMAMARRELPLAFSRRGPFLRKLIDSVHGGVIDTMDGIKLLDEGGWVHIHPKAHEPVVELIAEASSEEDAEMLVRKYHNLLDSILNE